MSSDSMQIMKHHNLRETRQSRNALDARHRHAFKKKMVGEFMYDSRICAI